MKWFSLAIAAVVLSVAADAEAGNFWRTRATVYHASGAQLAGDSPHRWHHQPASYGLNLDHGYLSGNAWYHNHDFYHGAFYYGRQGCRSYPGLWSNFCHEKCHRRKQGGCNSCGRTRQRGCGCAAGHHGHGWGHHGGCGCGHHSPHHPHHGKWEKSVPQLPEAAPDDDNDVPNPPTPKPDVSAGLIESWPHPFAFLSGKREG